MYPFEVQHMLDRIAAATDNAPVKTEKISNGYIVTVENSRVKFVTFFKTNRHGTKYDRGALFVDGEERPLCGSDKEFKILWLDPENAGTLRFPFYDEADIADAPLMIRHEYQYIVKKTGPVLKVGRRGKRWMIGIDVPGKLQFRILYRHDGKRPYLNRIWIIVNGIDRTGDAEDSIEKALSILAGVEIPSTNTIQKAHGSTRTRTNSVEVRNTVVIRN